MRSKSLWKTTGLLVAATMAATIARAQSPIQLTDAPASADIVVTGRPEPTRQEIERTAKAITRVSDLVADSLARFEDRICPGVVGLPFEIASQVADRIRYNAERVGAPVDTTEVCTPNIIIAFVRNGAAEIRRLDRRRGFLLAGLESEEAREVLDETGPVRAWNVTALRTRFGEVESPGLQRGPVQINGSFSAGPVRVTMVPSSDSKIFLASRHDITSASVIIDVASVDGRSINQIADYATMRALARTRPADGDASPPTILSLFDIAGRGPPEMTDFDLAYMRSLYDAGSNVPALVKIGGISRELRRGKSKSRQAVQQRSVNSPLTPRP